MVPEDEKFSVEKNFESLLSTIILFLEQDTFLNAPMNLDVNFCHVCQDNLTKGKGTNIQKSIMEENGNTFQNSPIYLMFYEKEP